VGDGVGGGVGGAKLMREGKQYCEAADAVGEWGGWGVGWGNC